MSNLENYIRAHALKNSLEFNKTSTDRIIPKLFQHGLKKENIREVMPEINKIIKEVNSLSASER